MIALDHSAPAFSSMTCANGARSVEAERDARKAGKIRKQAIYAAYDRFYNGDIARELVRGVQEAGGRADHQSYKGSPSTSSPSGTRDW